MISKWMVTGLSTVLALSILVPTANADKLSELEQNSKKHNSSKVN
nr:hypothetical protein [Planococcus glaciei]